MGTMVDPKVKNLIDIPAERSIGTHFRLIICPNHLASFKYFRNVIHHILSLNGILRSKFLKL